MRNVVQKYGLISGLIMIVYTGILAFVWSKYPNFNVMVVASDLGMIFSLSTVFFGIREYRMKNPDVVMTFGQGFVIGIAIAAIGSVLYAMCYTVYATYVTPDLLQKYGQFMMDDLRKRGAPQGLIDQKAKVLAEMLAASQNPLFNLWEGFLESFPVGLVYTLISALVLRTKKR